ncbi:tRNA pseudouridine synthase ACD [Kosmotoga arenicorallina S304]|uniref:tRNA pseudouridine synthase A n=1 Tax=Kosmotoga arenicorallina S304 TaxID=1453497 RepID=A0A176K1V8_9BACT|nr:tRNA pseudouridine(38-40) synthase TruA [Kosmotoga arenicorallina]OAA30879.1 tRNA pseudouridine synthase ACD [Kosmotoga arenicorallina S304]
MKRFAAVVAYDGTDFFGFQVQPDRRTVQGSLEEALAKIHKEEVRTDAAGRTDTGVHGFGQVIAFNSGLERLSPETMKDALNANLPDDIYVRKVYEVPREFSPRFHAKKRIYHYYILNAPEPDLFKKRYTWWFPYEIDIELIRKGASFLLGEHDFAAFRTGRDDRTTIRTITNIRVLRTRKSIVLIRVEGISFLRRMVRNIVGTLVRVGSGNLHPEAVKTILESKDRSMLPSSAPAQGLVLYKVLFDEFET